MTTKLNLYQKINKVHLEVTGLSKGATISMGSGRSYTAVTHDDVTALLHNPMAQNGIVSFPTMDSCDLEKFENEKDYNGKITKTIGYMVKVWASVKFVNIDLPSESETVKCFSYAMDASDKATGKAFSMAVKYCYLKVFNLESFDQEESRDFEHSHSSQYQNKTPLSNRPQNVLSNQPHNDDRPITEGQRNAITAISRSKNITVPDIKTFADASKWIGEQNKK